MMIRSLTPCFLLALVVAWAVESPLVRAAEARPARRGLKPRVYTERTPLKRAGAIR
jgi:hypothetical protein